jgi:hypothetical protein
MISAEVTKLTSACRISPDSCLNFNIAPPWSPLLFSPIQTSEENHDKSLSIHIACHGFCYQNICVDECQIIYAYTSTSGINACALFYI